MFKKTCLADRRLWLVALMVASVCPVFGAAGRKLAGHVPAVVSHLTPSGDLAPTKEIQLAIGLPLRKQAELDELIGQLYDPGSTNFHRFLTAPDFAARFGPTEADYAAVKNFAETNGFRVTGTHPNRVVLDVSAKVADIERAFGVKLHTYRHPTEARDFYAPDSEPSVELPLLIEHISGLDNYALPRPKSVAKPLTAAPAAAPRAGSGSGGSYLGNDFRAAYVPGTPLTGSGQSVALLQFDGYYTSDIAAYLTAAGYPASLINVLVVVPINGGVSTPGGGNGEVCLDIEMVMSMAPGVSKIYVYEGPNGGTAWSTILSKIANDNLARQVSCSWGATSPGAPDPTSEAIFKQMSAQGQSFFNASGDSDAFVSGIPFPAESTNITQVGATTLSTTGPGGTWTSETAWNWGFVASQNAYIGTSGGVSVNYGLPIWQQGISMTANHGSTTMRNVPDVALTGDNVFVTYNNGSSGAFGGTSCAAPLWAGFMALVNQQAALGGNSPVGFINPAVYAIGKGTNYTACFHDTASGNNYWSSSPTNFPAVTGFDLCTGWGTPNGTALINTLTPPAYFIAITNVSWALLAGSATPTNSAIDPGETVTVSFTLQNQGTLATSNLIATLQSNAGVLAPSGPQTYGALAGYGGSTNRSFTFTAAGACGSNITATLQLQNGSTNWGTVSFTLPLGTIPGLSQNFDGLVVPSLPSGWSSAVVSGAGNDWVTTTAAYDTAPNAAFNSESASAGQNALVSPIVSIVKTNAQLSFRHTFDFEYSAHPSRRFDGGVLEIKMGGGAFTDILSAGGSFVANGYNGNITTSSDNPLGGQSAWTSSSGGWKTVTVNLPAAAAGQNIQLRWNCATDSGNSVAVSGWTVDSISIVDAVTTCLSVFTDLAVGQSLAPGSLQPGQNLVYTLSVTNLGPQSAANVVLTDSVPVNATFVSAPGGSHVGGTVTFPVGTLAMGVVTNFTLTLSPASGSTFTNLASVSTVTPEISTANNTNRLIATQAVQTPAGISVGPSNQTVECSGNVLLSVSTTGTLPLVIQWSTNSVPVIGATNSNLSLANIHLPGLGVSVTVTNAYGSATSNAVVTVVDTLPPLVTLNGAGVMTNELGQAFVDPGATAIDTCAGGLPVITNGVVNVNVVGTNTLTYKASDGNGNTNTATRTVIVHDTTPPVISWSFTNLVVAANSNCVAIMPDVTGTNYLIATDLSGAVTVSQSPTNTLVLQLGTNVVVITVKDASGNAAFSTNTIVVQDQTPPVIASQPQSQTNVVGSTATFTVTATACTSLAFQWYSNNVALPLPTNSTLTLANLTTSAAGNYFVVATASGGSSTSAVATLTVNLIPPGINSVAASLDGSFNLDLTGSPGYTYILEATTNLAPLGSWLPIATNTLGTNGTWHFSDSAATNFPLQFYRLMLVQ